MYYREKVSIEHEVEKKYLKSKKELEGKVKNQIKKLFEEKNREKRRIRKEYRESQKRKLRAKVRLENNIMLKILQSYCNKDIAKESNRCIATVYNIRNRNKCLGVVNTNRIREHVYTCI